MSPRYVEPQCPCHVRVQPPDGEGEALKDQPARPKAPLWLRSPRRKKAEPGRENGTPYPEDTKTRAVKWSSAFQGRGCGLSELSEAAMALAPCETRRVR